MNKSYIETMEKQGRELYEAMRPYRVAVPLGQRGPWTLAHYESKFDVLYLWEARDQRPTGIGVHTRLTHRDHADVWMSDTAPEILDLLYYADRLTGRVLVSGLGIGLTLHVLTQLEQYSRNVESITVIEKDADIAALVGPYYLALDKRITIHTADAFEWQPPPGLRWDAAWHDIWPDISPKNLPEMERLRTKYVEYLSRDRQFFWGEKETLEKENWRDPVGL